MELRVYLKRKGFEEPEIEDALTDLHQTGELDDSRYLAAITRHHLARGKGAAYIVARLRAKGVDTNAAAVKRVMGDSGFDETKKVEAIIEKRYAKSLEDQKGVRKVYQALLSRGFSGETIQQVLKRLLRAKRP